ncbi:MAG: hypothetical protein ACFFEY_16230 [Candidatus Thorarchaeota archaeon]
MARVEIYCRKCGKRMRMDFSDTSTICKKCRKEIPEKVVNTTRYFDF